MTVHERNERKTVSDLPGAAAIPLQGLVIGGRGKAGRFLGDDRSTVEEQLGEQVYEGSLNLVLRRPIELRVSHAVLLDGGLRPFWPASVSGISVWIYRPPGAPEHIVELVADRHLRSALNLRDGDQLTVRAREDDVAPVPLRRLVIWALVWLGRRKWYYTSDFYLARVGSVRRALRALRDRRFRDLWQQAQRAYRRFLDLTARRSRT